MLTQPSRLQGWSNLFMSTAKEASDLGHQTAGHGIYRSGRGEQRCVIRFSLQGENSEGCILDTLPLGWEENIQTHYTKGQGQLVWKVGIASTGCNHCPSDTGS